MLSISKKNGEIGVASGLLAVGLLAGTPTTTDAAPSE